MKQILFVLLMIISSLSAAYQVGDVVDDVAFTGLIPSTGETIDTSIHEVIDSGKALIMFFGGTG
ncbi:MAG: hypothetical protein JXR48_10400 [Candidatus Delongbacteria bacterium]|nr:hypothetical protein [Candidatus Delongbacteria bacterium]MBN2835366.1 hypothetical protein [Candidatus Delongbacteria bacterium]